MRLTERDRHLIRAVYQCRVLTASLVAALFFPSPHLRWDKGPIPRRCLYRLRLLSIEDYLFRDELPQKRSEGRGPFVYFLNWRGAQLLAEEANCFVHELDWRAEHNSVGHPFLLHLLDTNKAGVALAAGAKAQGLRLIEWVNEQTLRRNHKEDTVTLAGPRGASLTTTVVPDAFFRLAKGNHTFHFFLELDRGTVTGYASKWGSKDWRRKVHAYLEFYNSGLYERRYHTKDMRVLTVTTNEERLQYLKRLTEQQGGRGRFLFTTLSAIRPDTIFSAPIWRIANREGEHSLV